MEQVITTINWDGRVEVVCIAHGVLVLAFIRQPHLVDKLEKLNSGEA